MNVAIVGAGLIGKKRASSLEKNDFLSIVYDINEVFAKELAHEFSTNYTGNIKDIINNTIQNLMNSKDYFLFSRIGVSSIYIDNHLKDEMENIMNITN